VSNTTPEVWKVIEDFPDYAVSDHGRVKRVTDSFSPTGIRNGKTAGRVLRTPPDVNGYPAVTLSAPSGPRRFMRVHQLVAAVFLGARPLDTEVNHLDSDRMNPAISNLEYVSHARNIEHSFQQKRQRTGEHHEWAKLCQNSVNTIRLLYASGWFTQKCLGQVFHVRQSTISRIVLGQKWRWGSNKGGSPCAG